MARLWERRGYRVIEEAGVYWVHYRGPLWTTFPNSVGIVAETREMEDVLWKARMAAARVPSMESGIPCALHVLEPAGYRLEKISHRHRKKVIRGLERCEVRIVDFDELEAVGLELNRDTLARQGRHEEEFTDAKRWKHFVKCLRETAGCQATGAYLNGRLSAYLIECRDGEWLRLLYKNSRSAELIEGTNYALDYTVIERASKDPTIRAIDNSFASTAGDFGVDTYKRHLGYVEVPTSMAIYLHPAIAGWATSRAAVGAARVAARISNKRAFELAARTLEAARDVRGAARGRATRTWVTGH